MNYLLPGCHNFKECYIVVMGEINRFSAQSGGGENHFCSFKAD